jgi:benzoyl-CoA reductase subunit D
MAALEEEIAKIKGMAVTIKSHNESPHAGAIGAALWGAFRHDKLAKLGQLRLAS